MPRKRYNLEQIINSLREALSRIKLFKNKGGFVLGPTQHLLSEIPLENILTMYEVAYRYGGKIY